MTETSKGIKRLIREFAATAHEEELRRALLPLADAFKQWEREELDSFALQERIHKFHQGAASLARWIGLRFRPSCWTTSLDCSSSIETCRRAREPHLCVRRTLEVDPPAWQYGPMQPARTNQTAHRCPPTPGYNVAGWSRSRQ